MKGGTYPIALAACTDFANGFTLLSIGSGQCKAQSRLPPGWLRIFYSNSPKLAYQAPLSYSVSGNGSRQLQSVKVSILEVPHPMCQVYDSCARTHFFH